MNQRCINVKHFYILSVVGLCLVMYVLFYKNSFGVNIKEGKPMKAMLELFPKILDSTKKIRSNQNLSSTNSIAEVNMTKDWSHLGVHKRTPQRWVVLSLAVFKAVF